MDPVLETQKTHPRRTRIDLRDRELDIFKFLLEMRFATAEQLWSRFYKTERETPETKVYPWKWIEKRLRKLKWGGYIKTARSHTYPNQLYLAVLSWSSFLLGIALSSIWSSAYGDCIACTSSRGVLITSRSGDTEKGYVAWNEYFYLALIGIYGEVYPPVKGIVEQRGWSIQEKIDLDEAFQRWCDLLNHAFKQGTIVKKPYITSEYVLFRRLEKIKYPLERFVGIQGEVVRIPFEGTAAISPSPDMTLSVDTTGMDVLPKEDVERLQKDEPRFTVEDEGDAGATVYAVYGGTVSVEDLLGHILHGSAGNPGNILVNQKPIRAGSRRWPVVDSTKTQSPDPVVETGIARFLERLQQYQSAKEAGVAPCWEEAHALARKFGTLERDDPRTLVLREEASKKGQTCGEKERELVNRFWRRSGDKEKLRELGVIQFSYAWD